MEKPTDFSPPHVTIYTDGACLGNPGPGGYGVVLRHQDRCQELCGGARLTTNNRMEILAAVVGLRALQGRCAVTLYSDSRYLVDAMTKGWVRRWQANGWVLSSKAPALNVDLWQVLLELCQQHQVSFRWVKGHAGNRDNERCDALAVQAAQRRDLPPDLPYERTRGAAGAGPRHLAPPSGRRPQGVPRGARAPSWRPRRRAGQGI
jgi:ribonuclease HI